MRAKDKSPWCRGSGAPHRRPVQHLLRGRDDQVRLGPDSCGQVRDVVRRRVRLERLRPHVQLGLRPVKPFLLRLVERSVVELADVAHQRGENRRLGRFRRCLARAGASAASAVSTITTSAAAMIDVVRRETLTCPP